MLKRYQILLNEWIAEHYKLVSNTYDVSFSEMVRMALCVDIMVATRAMFPHYKWKIKENLLRDVMRERGILQTMGREQFHKFLSEIYFETRKATELWAQMEEEKKNSKSSAKMKK